jgi:hypothetical protein
VNGWVKLWRKSMESAVFTDADLWKLWTLCLMLANHKTQWVSIDGRSAPVEVQPGQFITGRNALHEAFYPKPHQKRRSAKTIWRWMHVLQNMQNLTIKTSNKCSLVTICNWSTYQDRSEENVQQNVPQASSTCPADVQQMSTNKNDQKEKKEEKEERAPANSSPCDAPSLAATPADPLAYVGASPADREWMDRMVNLYRLIWQKPGYHAAPQVLNDMVTRREHYKARDPDAVATVIRKSRRLYEAGDSFYGANCSLSTLMGERMFAQVFEAQDPKDQAQTRRYPEEKRMR